MTPMIEPIMLAGGRRLEVAHGGDPAGISLVLHHGTPSDATAWTSWSEVCAARGVRLIAMSRPGYAGSDRQPGRIVADAASDTASVLDRLGVGEFFTLGWSGGGPHALACAGLLEGRCLGASILAGLGPLEMGRADFLDGMGPENVAEFGAALTSEAELRRWLERHAGPYRKVSGEALGQALGGLVPQIDRDVLDQGYGEELASVMRRALAPGFDGWIDDDLAFTRPWGFPLDAIRTPVTLWQGELDLMVPQAHGRWMARMISGARFEFAPGHGHISLGTRFRTQILDGLLVTTS